MPPFNAPAYDIERPTGQCAFTGRAMEPGEPYMAALVELPEGVDGEQPTGLGLKRIDVSMQTWSGGKRPDHLFGYWQSTIPQPNQKRRLFVDNEILMNLFRRLGETEQPERLAFRFVLGLILMRKKLLRYDGTEKRAAPESNDAVNKEEWWLVSPKLDLTKGPLGRWNEDGQMELLNPHLGDEQIQQVTEQLGEILATEF